MNFKKTTHLILIFILISFTNLHAQNRLKYAEYGIGVGTLSYSGDIATSPGVSSLVNEIRPNFKAFAMKHFNDWLGIGAEVSYGWIYADDLNHDNPSRGYSVRTDITQFNGMVEANLIRYGKFHYEQKFGLYIQVGGGFLAFNPKTSFEKLEPEGITLYPNSYSGTNFFFTIGTKFRTAYKQSLRLELYFHNTGNDYLDGFIFTDRLSKNDFFGGVGLVYSFLSY